MPPLNLLIKPASSLCNMRCRYCFYADVAQNRARPSCGMMSVQTLEGLVRRAFAYAEGAVTFAFQGGEPTLAGLDFYRTLIRLEDTYNTEHVRVFNSIQTNGVLIDDEWAAFLAENRFLVGLSMDGFREAHDALRVDADGHGTYDRTVRAARTLDRHHADYNILCVVSDEVARHPIKTYETLKKYKYVQFIPCLDPLDGDKAAYSLSEERYARFLCETFDRYYRDFMKGQYVSIRNFDNYVRMLLGYPPESCAMTGRCTCSGVVEGDGSVYPCDFYVLDEWRLGSVPDDDFGAMLTSDKARAFVRRSAPVPDACRACRWYRLCRNGCQRERSLCPDGLPGVTRHCEALRIFFDACIGRMAEMAEKVKNTPEAKPRA